MAYVLLKLTCLKLVAVLADEIVPILNPQSLNMDVCPRLVCNQYLYLGQDINLSCTFFKLKLGTFWPKCDRVNNEIEVDLTNQQIDSLIIIK